MSAVALLIDRAIQELFPGWASRRLLARVQCDMLRVRRDAGKIDRLSAKNRHSTAGPNDKNSKILETTRAQARDLYRTNPYARGAINSIVANLVGTGIRPQARVIAPRLLEPDEDFNDRANDEWRWWADGSDPSGKTSFYEQESQAVQELYVAGEAIFLRSEPLDDRPVPLALELVPSERLANLDERRKDGSRVVQGVETDSRGKVAAYWIYPNHPSESWSFAEKPQRIDADRIIHLFKMLEPGQMRGVTRLMTIAPTLEAFMQWCDFLLTKEQVASAFALMITQNERGLNTIQTSDSSDDTDDVGNRIGTLEGGMIFEGRPGEGIAGVPSNIRASEVNQFASLLLRQVARGLDCAYELVSRDLSQVTYLSARQGENQDRRHWEPEQQFLIRRFGCPVWRDFVRMASIAGRLRLPPRADIRRFCEVEFVTDGWDWVDPSKDVQADILAVQAGLASAQELIMKRGKDPWKLLEENAQFKQWAAEKGLDLAIFQSKEPQGNANDQAESASQAASA